jgi:hypothetical protein
MFILSLLRMYLIVERTLVIYLGTSQVSKLTVSSPEVK